MFLSLLLTDAPAQTSAIVVAIAHCVFDAAAAVAVETTAVAQEGGMLLRRLSIVAPFAAIILRIVLGETTAHGLTQLTGPPILNRLLLHR